MTVSNVRKDGTQLLIVVCASSCTPLDAQTTFFSVHNFFPNRTIRPINRNSVALRRRTKKKNIEKDRIVIVNCKKSARLSFS